LRDPHLSGKKLGVVVHAYNARYAGRISKIVI
jgi:hypothetical protein